MTARILRPGLQTTVQDLGRYGLQHFGIVPCGAMDPVAHRVANALVGNDPGAATLECTVIGPEIEFRQPALVALCGAIFDATVDSAPFPLARPVLIEGGTRVSIGTARQGARGYLAVAGGFGVAPVLGSRSTYIPAGFGGFEGRALRAGDTLAFDAGAVRRAQARFAKTKSSRGAGSVRSTSWSVPALTLPRGETVELRAMAGRHIEQFDAASQRAFFDTIWRVSPDSNRMGYRLIGPMLSRPTRNELLSEPTCLGTVQSPNDGAPIVLMADHQTTGGYPKIAEVASADIPLLAQLAPGGSVRFARCSLEEARAARGELEARLAAVLQGISLQYGN